MAVRVQCHGQVTFDFRVEVAKGDKLFFRVNMNQNIAFDTTAFDPTIAYDNGETHTAQKSSATSRARTLELSNSGR